MSGKDIKIDIQTNEIKDLKSKMDEQAKRIEVLLGYAVETKDQLVETNHQLEDTRIQNEEILEEVGALTDKVDELRITVRERNEDVAIPPINPEKLDMYALYRVDTNRYRMVCGQSRHIQRTLRDVPESDVLIRSTYNPNPKTMFVRVKDCIDLENIKWIRIRYKSFILDSVENENELVELVKKCDVERSELEIP